MAEYQYYYNDRTPPNRRESPQRPPSSYSNHKLDDIDNDYNSKYHHLKKWYETRVRELSEDIKKAFLIVQSDVLIETMRQDPASREFINQRVQEIIEDCLSNDREILLEKMAAHCSQLKSDYTKLEQDSIKFHDQQDQMIAELNSRIERLQAQCKDEVTKRENFENEAEKLKISLHNTTRRFQESSNIQEDQLKRIEENEVIERRELGSKIREEEEKNLQLTDKLLLLQKDLDIQKVRYREQQIELNALNTELKLAQEKYKEAHKRVREYDREEHELKMTVEDLKQQNEKLVQNFNFAESELRDRESKIGRMIQEIESEKERDIEKINRNYREKIEVFKKKLRDYKERLSAKENDLQLLQKRSEEEKEKSQKNMLFLEERIQDQRVILERTTRTIEEENYQKIGEVRRQYEEQLKAVQGQLKTLLDQKVSQLQEDADEHIHYLKKQEKELQGLLEDKRVEMERDYVKRDQYENVIEERNNAFRKMKEELARKDFEHQQDVQTKVKNAEEKLIDDFSTKQKALKAVISENEQHIRELNENLNLVEQKLRLINDEKKVLLETLEELEIQKRRSNESIEDWEIKCKKLKVACDEEQLRRNDLERELRIYQERFKELTEKLEEYSKEKDDKENQLRHLNYEATNLQVTLKEASKDRKRLDRDFDDLNRAFIETTEMLKFIQEDNRLMKEENKRLADKIKEIISAEAQKFDKEVGEHMKTKTRLKNSEEKVFALTAKVEENEYLIQQLRRSIDDHESQNRQLTSRIDEYKEKIEDLNDQRSFSERKVEKILMRASMYRRNTFSKLETMKTELADIKNYIRSFVSSLIRQYELKFLELQNRIKYVMEQKEKRHNAELEAVKEKLYTEANENSENLKLNHQEVKASLQEEFEKRYSEQTKTIERMEDENRGLEDRLNEAEREIERRDFKESQLERELFETKREREGLGIKLEQAKQVYIKQIEEAHEEIDRLTTIFEEQRKAMEERYAMELDMLKTEHESLKSSYADTVQKYEVQLYSLTEEQEAEVNHTKKDLRNAVNKMEDSIEDAQEIEHEFIEKIAKLENKITKMKDKNVDLEKENESLKEMYQRKVKAFEERMAEVGQILETETQAMMFFKDEKMKEISQYMSTIQNLQGDVRERDDRIDSIIGERRKLEQSIRELEGDLSIKIDEISTEKQDLLRRTLQQTKEIEQLHSLLSQAYQIRDERFEETRKRVPKETEQASFGVSNYGTKKGVSYNNEGELEYYKIDSMSSRTYGGRDHDRSKLGYYDSVDRSQTYTARGDSSKKKKF